MSADGVPPWARPVLEALAQASDHRDWMSRAAEIDAAYQQLSDVCRAALASDAAAPEGEPFFHSLGCPRVSGRGTAAHCTCPPDRERPERTPAAESTTNAPETSASLVDAELNRLLIEYARCQVQARYASRSQPEINRRAYAVEYAAAAIHAHVERVKRAARGEVVALVRATVADDALAATYQTMGSYRTALLQYLDVQDGRVGNTVRRREKEEG